jgi:hypothetical protein
MSDETDNVDPENPRPAGHYPRFRDNEWHYVPDELARSVSLGPGGDGEDGQDWVLTYTPEKRYQDDREKVLVRLTPRALHELYIEVKDLDVETRQMGHRAECDFCGEMVDMDRAIPNQRGEPCHKHCWAEYTGAPGWFADHV